jgi:hypothetical protein
MPPVPPYCDFKNRQGLSLGISTSGKYYLVDTKSSENVGLDEYLDSCCSSGEDCIKLSVLYSEAKNTNKNTKAKDMCLDYQFNSDNYSPDLHLTVLPEFIYTEPKVMSEVVEVVNQQPEDLPSDINIVDSLTALAASAALILGVVQNARAKKRELESAKCCSESKLNIERLDSKLAELDKRIDSARTKDNKALHAEMYEHYKELKELKEDSDELKDILQKVVERLKA